MAKVGKGRFVLYRFYDDAEELLYVGASADLITRMAQHSQEKPWWGDVADVKVQHFDTFDELVAAESHAIKAEKPLHNVIHNDVPMPWVSKPRRERGSGSFYQRADGMWVGRVELPSVNGKRKYKIVKSRDQADAMARFEALKELLGVASNPTEQSAANRRPTKRPACACGHVHASHPNEGACERCKCQQYRERPRRTRGEGSFFQRADGTWIGRVELAPLDGKRRTRVVKSMDRNVAIAKLKQLRADVEAGRIAVTTNTSVEKWMLHWIDNIHAKRKVRPGVIQDYRACIVNHINPAIGRKRIDKMTPQHVRDMHTAIGPRRTAELAHVILSKALKDATREGVVTRNVAELVDKPVYQKAKRDGFEVEVAKHIIATAFKVCEYESDAVRIAAGFLTGARRGELLGLRWPYVNQPNRPLLTFAWQLQSLTQDHGCGDPLPEPSPLARSDRKPSKPPYWPCGKARAAACPERHWNLPAHFDHELCEGSLLFTRPKTEAGWRVVPAIPVLHDAMMQLRTPNRHDLVWHHDGNPIDPRADYDIWRNVFRAAGVIGPTESLPPHNSRHTTATLLRAAGVDEQTRMEILGHATADSQRVYAHADRARHIEAMGSLAELLG